ncbi:galactose ABC transporter substrate-binding protein [Vallitalea okinawensis]|uniref:galactose ABC transporter substrate-binding protein n=1 Tax=Vallitalea okinawensis TaxID=2078660 RepID=UPI000CFAE91B|nr:galactose ABC transporter substrate-binding protein [Vallitalea okinawensis]
MGKNVVAILLILLMVMNIGCLKADEVMQQDSYVENEIKIGILIYRFDDQFISSVKATIIEQAEEINAMNPQEIIVDIVDGKNQQDIQDDQIDHFIQEDYDALAINLVDRSNAANVIDKAKQADIPIVFFNREPVEVDMARWEKTYYVGAKAEDSGIIQGEIAVSYWMDNPQVDKNGDGIMQYVMLEGQPGHQDALLRTKYAINAVVEQGIEVEELVRDTANWQRSEAKDKMATWLDFFGDDIEFIFSNNDAMALGAIDAMKASEVAYNIPVVGVDAIESAIEALETGEIIGTVNNDNAEQGKMVMNMAYYLAINEDPNDYIPDIVNGTYLWIPYEKVLPNID